MGFEMANTQEEIVKKYWQSNLRLLAVLLGIWFVVSFGCGVLFVDQLDTIQFFGFNLGFWFAQQGSIYVFVCLIFFYVWKMNRLDDSLAQSSQSKEDDA